MGNKNIDELYWMKIVDQIAEASTCRVKIGCIIIEDRQIASAGYVGSAPGEKHCAEVGCLYVDTELQGSSGTGKSCIRTIHAELNAVLKYRPLSRSNYREAYCTYQPCLGCLKALISVGVGKIVYRKPYKDVWRDLFIKDMVEGVTMFSIDQYTKMMGKHD